MYSRPLSCDGTSLMPLELHELSVWLCLPAKAGVGQWEKRLPSAAVDLPVSVGCPVRSSSPLWSLPRPAADASHGSPVRRARLRQLRSGAASARFAHLSSPQIPPPRTFGCLGDTPSDE